MEDNHSLLLQAIEAACEVAKEYGLPFQEAVVLHNRSNILVHLQPTPVVARVAAATSAVRQGSAWLAREVAVVTHLAAAGSPVVPPSQQIPPGPHEYEGLFLSFWQFVEKLPGTADPYTIGRALYQCHQALTTFEGQLPVFSPMEEINRLLPPILNDPVFTAEDVTLLHQVMEQVNRKVGEWKRPFRPVHGDSHFNNVFHTTQGVLWGDWEDTFLGPVEWDVASLVASSRIFGEDMERAHTALTGYGDSIDETALALCLDIRVLWTVLWSIILGRQHPPLDVERFQTRLYWLRNRYGCSL